MPTTQTHAPAPQTPPPTKSRRGNPNLNLAPRCGARTRAGCPCRAPAIRDKLRCRMHGGRSTGPRTTEGLASLRQARTIHGLYTPEARARNRHYITFLRRGRVVLAAVTHRAILPPELATRLDGMPPEFKLLPWPTVGLTRAQDRAALQAETAALAPWKTAIAAARDAHRAARAATRATCAIAPTKPHTPEPGPTAPAAPRSVATKPHTPELSPTAPAASRSAAAKPHAPEPSPTTPAAPRSVAAKPHAPVQQPSPAIRQALLATTTHNNWALAPHRSPGQPGLLTPLACSAPSASLW